MNKVVSLKKYTPPDQIQHVTYRKQEIEQTFHCPTCGDLQVIDGIVWHIKSEEDHERDRQNEPKL